MTTQNRYYSNTSQATTLTNPGGIDATETDLQVAATTGNPISFPFVLRIEFGTVNEEAVLVTSGAGSSGNPYVMTRGYDNTVQRSHAQGVPVAHGFVAADFAEPQQHITLTGSTSAAHGLPASAWFGGTMQTIASVSPAANQASIQFTSIPQTFSHLLIMYELSVNGAGAGIDTLFAQFNGVTATDYGSAIWATSSSSVTGSNSFGNNIMTVGYVWKSGTPAFGTGLISIPNYSTSTYHNLIYLTAAGDGGIGGSAGGGGGGFTNNAAPVTSMKIFPQNSTGFASGGLATLYGLV